MFSISSEQFIQSSKLGTLDGAGLYRFLESKGGVIDVSCRTDGSITCKVDPTKGFTLRDMNEQLRSVSKTGMLLRAAPVGDQNIAIGSYDRKHVSVQANGMLTTRLPDLLSSTKSDVVFVEDTHGSTPVANIFTYPAAKKLKNMGFTHYLIEGSVDSQPSLDILNTHTKPIDIGTVNNLAPFSYSEHADNYRNAIINMASGKLDIVAIDIPTKQEFSREEREDFIHQNIEKVFF